MRDTGRLLGATLTLGVAFTLCGVSARAASTLTNVHTFQGTDGGWPSSIVVGDDGNFYGTTEGGGADFHDPNVNSGFGSGTVFKMTPAGVVTVLHSFLQSDDAGSSPTSLIKADDGNFYGLTTSVVFKITPDGTFTILHTFNQGDLTQPKSLMQASDGNLYGTTLSSPDTSRAGGFFQLTLGGAYKIVTEFGSQPGILGGNGPITQVASGDFVGACYGLSQQNAVGQVYKIDSQGNATPIHNFTAQENRGTRGGLIQLSDGRLIGTTTTDNFPGSGTVFSLDSANTLTTLHTFTGRDGIAPQSALTLGADGLLYGATAEGGPAYTTSSLGNGVVYVMTDTGGDFVKIGDFDASYGQDVEWPLVKAPSGDFYGVATHGGPGAGARFPFYGPGSVFKVSPVVHIFPAGLQLISTPYDYTGNPVANLLTGSAAKLAVWNPSTFSYAVTPTAPADTFHQGGAAWVRFSQPTALIIRGSDITVNNQVAVPLKVGWNMIGDASTIDVPIANLTVDSGASNFTFAQAVSNGLVSSTMYSYDTTTNAYVSHTSGDSLQAYTGYWLFAPTACTLEIPNIPPP